MFIVNRWIVVAIFILMVVMGGLVKWDRWVFFSSLCLFSIVCVTYLMAICKKVSMSLFMLWVVTFRSLRYFTMCVRIASNACNYDGR